MTDSNTLLVLLEGWMRDNLPGGTSPCGKALLKQIRQYDSDYATLKETGWEGLADLEIDSDNEDSENSGLAELTATRRAAKNIEMAEMVEHVKNMKLWDSGGAAGKSDGIRDPAVTDKGGVNAMEEKLVAQGFKRGGIRGGGARKSTRARKSTI